jgi:hypothetical protein
LEEYLYVELDDDSDDEELGEIEELLAAAGAWVRAEPVVVPPFDPMRRTTASMQRGYCRRPPPGCRRASYGDPG